MKILIADDKAKNVVKIIAIGILQSLSTSLGNRCYVMYILYIVFQLSDIETYNICINCFMMASMAYKFYLLSKRSQEILHFYTNELLENVERIQLPDEIVNNTLCISLPEILTETPVYDFNLHSIGKEMEIVENNIVKKEMIETVEKDDNDDVVVIIQDNGEPAFYRTLPDGTLQELEGSEVEKYRKKFNASVAVDKKEDRIKKGRKRGPMSYKLCTRCPVKYRFITKLKQHMLMDHNVTLYVCKVKTVELFDCNCLIK